MILLGWGCSLSGMKPNISFSDLMNKNIVIVFMTFVWNFRRACQLVRYCECLGWLIGQM